MKNEFFKKGMGPFFKKLHFFISDESSKSF